MYNKLHHIMSYCIHGPYSVDIITAEIKTFIYISDNVLYIKRKKAGHFYKLVETRRM